MTSCKTASWNLSLTTPFTDLVIYIFPYLYFISNSSGNYLSPLPLHTHVSKSWCRLLCRCYWLPLKDLIMRSIKRHVPWVLERVFCFKLMNNNLTQISITSLWCIPCYSHLLHIQVFSTYFAICNPLPFHSTLLLFESVFRK